MNLTQVDEWLSSAVRRWGSPTVQPPPPSPDHPDGWIEVSTGWRKAWVWMLGGHTAGLSITEEFCSYTTTVWHDGQPIRSVALKTLRPPTAYHLAALTALTWGAGSAQPG
ncbi:hypothetical protein [Actinopolymorpha alba]|uniref:hypothetical protein n=1 Tax=Actinopolymorpha alba TaxID=533267 RepID=UPI000367C2B7|nr:hypothetical protein [Actinopolymorpha alba]